MVVYISLKKFRKCFEMLETSELSEEAFLCDKSSMHFLLIGSYLLLQPDYSFLEVEREVQSLCSDCLIPCLKSQAFALSLQYARYCWTSTHIFKSAP